jgi:amidase
MAPLTRSLADLRLAFPIIAEPGSPGLDQPLMKDLSQLRIAWTGDFGGVPLDHESLRMMHTLADRLANAGGQVENCADAGFDYEEAWFTAGACLGAINTLFQPHLLKLVRKLIGPMYSRFGRPHPLQRGLFTGVSLRPQTIQDMLKKRGALSEQLERFLSKWDA